LGLDLWALNVLGERVRPEIKGMYVAATSLARGLNLLVFVATAVMVPSIARAMAQDDIQTAQALVRGAIRLLMIVVLPVAVLVAVNAREIMALFFSQDYERGGHYLAILIFAHGLGYCFMMTLQAGMVGLGLAPQASRRIFAGVAVALLLSLWLIPRFGAEGAGFGSLFAFYTVAGLNALAVRRRLGSIMRRQVVVSSAFGSATVLCLGWLIPAKGLLVVLELTALGSLYLLIAWFTGVIQKQDLQLLWRRPAQAGK
jgi:O-antigen/teichoic acid export membrane protein